MIEKKCLSAFYPICITAYMVHPNARVMNIHILLLVEVLCVCEPSEVIFSDSLLYEMTFV